MTSRELVYSSLNFEMGSEMRIPRQMWVLPWADEHFPGVKETIQKEFPDDIVHAPGFHTSPVNARTVGDEFKIGTYVDPWGCIFENRQSGIIGEVKQPIVDDWNDTSRVHIPEEALTIDVGQVNAFCRGTDRFVLAGACHRPF